MKNGILEECYSTLKGYLKTCIEKTKIQTEKVLAFKPSDGLYDSIWPDDFAFPTMVSPESLSKEDYQRIADFISVSCQGLVVVPDRVRFDGMPIMSPGPFGEPISYRMPAHLPSAWVRLLIHLEKQGVTLKNRDFWAKLIERSFENVDFKDGLVYINPEKPYVGFAYHDCIAISGYDFFSSIVTMKGLRRAATFFQNDLPLATREKWLSMSSKIKSNLTRLLDPKKKAFLAGSDSCRQVNIWANGLYYGDANCEEKQGIRDYLIKHMNQIIHQGCTRQIAESSGWEKQLLEMPINSYMNGGYWPTGTGYIFQAIYETDHELGKQLLRDLITALPKYEYPEWISPNGIVSNERYFHMAIAIPMLAIRSVIDGGSLFDYF